LRFMWFLDVGPLKSSLIAYSHASDERHCLADAMVSEWHDRTGAEKLAPARPSLEEILRLVDNPAAVANRLGLLQKQRQRFEKLLSGLSNVADSILDLDEDQGCYIGGSFGRETALNYHFDADLVVFIQDFDYTWAQWYQDELCAGLMDQFRRHVTCGTRTPYTLKLNVGNFATVDVVTTGEPPDYEMDEDEWRFYSGADSWRVDKEIMDFGVAHPEFRPMVLLVKHWRNLRFPSIRSITSYHLELLCMEVIEASESRNLRDLFREFLEWVAYGEDNLYVENPNYYHGALQLNRHSMDLLASYAEETLTTYHRHIRPGNTAACPCCGERRFRSATGAVAHLESGNCLKCQGQEQAQRQIFNFVSQHKQTQMFLRPMLTDGYGSTYGDDTNPYQCTSCNRTFGKLSSLMAHRKDRHGQVLQAIAY